MCIHQRSLLNPCSSLLHTGNIFSALHDIYLQQKDEAKLQELDPCPSIRRKGTFALAIMKDPTAGMVLRPRVPLPTQPTGLLIFFARFPGGTKLRVRLRKRLVQEAPPEANTLRGKMNAVKRRRAGLKEYRAVAVELLKGNLEVALRTCTLWAWLRATALRGFEFASVKLGQFAFSFILPNCETHPTQPRVYTLNIFSTKQDRLVCDSSGGKCARAAVRGVV